MTTFNNNLSIPFPLSDGQMGFLYLPPQVSIKDARRLQRAIGALYINQRKSALGAVINK